MERLRQIGLPKPLQILSGPQRKNECSIGLGSKSHTYSLLDRVAAKTQSIKDDLCSAPYRFGDGNALMMTPDGLSDRSLQLLV